MPPAGFYTVNALDPDDPGGTLEAQIPKDLLAKLYKMHRVKWCNVAVAKEVLERPERVFHGIREHQEGGWCYTGRPASICNYEPEITIPLPPGFVFAVYLDPEYRVFEWRLEKADHRDCCAPQGYDERYGRLAWTRNS